MSDKTLFDWQKVDLKKQVEKILRDNPKARDNDFLLAALVWTQQMDPSIIDANDLKRFLRAFVNQNTSAEISNFKSVVRYRAMLQKQYEELRGLTYGKRQTDAEVIAFKVKSTGELRDEQPGV